MDFQNISVANTPEITIVTYDSTWIIFELCNMLFLLYTFQNYILKQPIS